MSEPFVSNIISQKYDTALDFHVTMYDKLPYERDSDYCNVEKLALVSGHVIKYYLYINQPEAFSIDNKDNEIEDILAQAAIVENNAASARKRIVSASSEEDVTQEQIQTLLDDQDSFSADENDIDAPVDAVNAFADVEDW